ncbi:MAG TPA: flagellar biosynthesis anti-sigma factor FlgM [Candidatus Limnocylindria bacterium]|jgi:anti-sigma28 factor (negative regulator of flagellin synthesis)|nr:flagellar biosynthesis anti-sigma factor FlgM [Candidatus Limnocylindria bacterium]
MIISRAEIASAISAYKTVKRKSTVTTVVFDTGDRYDGSDAGISLTGFVQSVVADPLYRADLVADLQRRIADGRYFVPSEDIVEKMLGRLILDYTASN